VTIFRFFHLSCYIDGFLESFLWILILSINELNESKRNTVFEK